MIFTRVGFTFNRKFTDEKATCMIISDNTFAMLLGHPFFKTFTKKEISNTHKGTEVLIALDAATSDEVLGMMAISRLIDQIQANFKTDKNHLIHSFLFYYFMLFISDLSSVLCAKMIRLGRFTILLINVI